MGIDLDQAIKDGSIIFQMPPVESQQQGAPPPAGEKPQEAGEKLPVAGEKPEVHDAEPPQPGEKPQAEAAPLPRFKTHEDAEKGYTDLQSKTTRVEQQNAELRKQLASFQEQENKKKQDQQAVEIKDFAVAKNKEALTEINKLDPEAPDHNDRVAEIWAEANMAVYDFRIAKKAEQQSHQPDLEPAQPDADVLAVNAAITNRLQSEKFNDEEQAVFWGFARTCPTHTPDGVQLTNDEQVSITMEKTKQFFANQRSRLLQEFDLPLDRGGSHTGPPPGARPSSGTQLISLDDAMAEADRVRTLT